MKNRFFWKQCVAGLLLFAPLMPVGAQDLATQMEEMDAAYKSFRREQDPAKGAAAAREAQEYVLKGMAEMPDLISKMSDPAAKAKATVEYRMMMAKMFITFCEAEAAFLANDLDKVAELVQAIRDHKKQGHDKFMEE
jgi:hypothetical protein